MNSKMRDYHLTPEADESKTYCLHRVGRKLILMTQEINGLDMLDFNFSKSERRVTFSAGFKPCVKPEQKFDLSPLFLCENDKNHANMGCCSHPKHPDIHCKEQYVTPYMDEKYRVSSPMGARNRHDRQYHATADSDSMSDIPLVKSKVFKPFGNRAEPNKADRDNTDDEEDTTSSTSTEPTVRFNDDVQKMDMDYMQHLQHQKDSNIQDAYTLDKKFKKLLKGFTEEKDVNDEHKNIKDDGISVFIPGQKWISQEAKRERDLAATMQQIENSILRQTINAYQVAYEVLLHAETFEREGRCMKQEIRRILSDPQKMKEQETNKDLHKDEEATGNKPEDNQTPTVKGKRITVKNARQAFTEYLKKDVKRIQEMKALTPKKTDKTDFTTEDKKKEKTEDYNDIYSFEPSYGSTMFMPQI